VKTKHRNFMCRFELNIGPGRTERAVEYNLTLDRLGLIIVNEVKCIYMYTGMEVISQYCYCSRLENKHNIHCKMNLGQTSLYHFPTGAYRGGGGKPPPPPKFRDPWKINP
jgi:hypothetical protein